MPNSVRKSAPVGHTSRHAAWVQCLQTSEDISQRLAPLRRRPRGSRCSTNATWRQVDALSPPCCRSEMPVQCSPSSGTSFHSLHATSHALQPMQIEVSVKKPSRGGCSRWPAGRRDRCPDGLSSCSGLQPLSSVMPARRRIRHECRSPGPRGRRPGRMSPVSALTSWMCAFGSSASRPGRSPSRHWRSRWDPSGRASRSGGRRPCTSSGVIRSVTSTRASITPRAVTIVAQPACAGRARRRAPARPRRRTPAAAPPGTAACASCRPRCDARSGDRS